MRDVEVEDLFGDLEDHFAPNHSTFILSTINDISATASACNSSRRIGSSSSISKSSKSSSSSKSSCSDILVSQFNNLTLDSALDNLCILTTTNKKGHKKTGYKLCSLGYYYTVEKSRLELMPTADIINWKCERISENIRKENCLVL